jgi:hypothetical protein
MPSRKIVLMGTGALALVVVLVARGGGGPSFKLVRGDGAQFPLRGSLADKRDAIDDALQAWKDGRGAASDSRAARISSADVHLLYAETIGERSVVVVEQGDRLIAMVNPLDRGWYVDGAEEGFDPFDESPARIGDAVLLPSGDWTYLPLTDSSDRPRTVDGLLTPDDAYGSLDPGFVVEGRQPSREQATKVFDTEVGMFRVDARTRRAIADAALRPGALLAIHAALIRDQDERIAHPGLRSFDVLWTGRLPGVPRAAVVARQYPDRLGLGLVTDPDGFVSGAASVDLGSQAGALRTRRQPGVVGAAYVPGDNPPRTVVAAGTAGVDRLEFLVGTRRFTRAAPVAVVPVDWVRRRRTRWSWAAAAAAR